jgi:flagellar motor switch protein FliM
VLDRLNERWITEFERKLGDLIRRPLEAKLEEVELASYGNWLAAMPVPSSFNLYAIKPWPRNALVAVDGKLLYALVNCYYGGANRASVNLTRETLTPTEQRINRILIDLTTDLFRRALAPVAALEFQHVQSETNASYLNMATPSETVVVTRVEVTLNEAGGTICMILPLSAFEPVRDKLAEGLKSVSAETRQRWRQSLRAQLDNTQLDLSTVFLEMEITMRELLKMKPGDILPIEMPKTATVRSGARALLRGKFGRSRGYNAVSVLEAVKSAIVEEARR